MDDRSDEQLVTAHLAGERAALATIYDRFADQLYDTAAAMLGDRHEAADVVQDVFVIAAERLGQLRDRSKVRPWLFAVLRNEVYRRSKRRRRATPTDFAAPGGVDVAAPTDASADAAMVELDELAATLRAAAAGLDARDQLVLELTTRQGLAGPDLADALGVSVEQSYVLVHRMRERVERSIGAFTVARLGRRDCPDLARLLAGWDGTFDVLVRKRVARHVDRCATCDRTRRAFAVLPLIGAAPALAAPPELRESVLGAAPSAGAATHRRRWRADGFPATRRGVGRVLLAIVVLLVIGAGIGGTIALAVGDGSGDSMVATPATTTTLPTNTPATIAPTIAPTVPPTAPPAVAPTAPPTVRPTVPPTAAPTAPPTAPPAAPGSLVVSSADLDLGATATAGTVRLTNAGGTTLRWTMSLDTIAPFSASTAGTQLAPGDSVDLVLGIDRTALAEGTIDRVVQIVSTAQGGGQVRLRATIEHPPAITVARALGAVACPWSVAPTVSALIDDESEVTSVVLSWSGPGRAGRAAMTEPSPDQWRGGLGIGRVNGTWTWVITATDSRANTSTRSGTIEVSGC